MGMDQQQDIKLDVKEAAVVPTDHPQWDITDSESEHQAQVCLKIFFHCLIVDYYILMYIIFL